MTVREQTTAYRELGIELGRHARLLHVVRGRMAATAPRSLDFSALALLMTLVRCGPRRQGELAETALFDPSTTSRYVAQLVKAGLVERRRDPDDGRAVVLAATPAGTQVSADLVARRDDVVREALAGWPGEDVATLTVLLRQLNDSLEESRPVHQTD